VGRKVKPKKAVLPVRGGVTAAAKKAVAKTAQRVRVIEAPVPCPHCEAPKTMPVLYYPPQGRPINARGCARCKAVWHPGSLTILAREVKL
jgi:hypothetical protein